MARILCIDDNPLYGDLLHLTLARDGFEVFDASNTPDALTILRDQSVDLILDNVYRLARADYDLLIEKKSDQTLRDIPLAVVVTGMGSLEQMLDIIAVKGLEPRQTLHGAITAPFTPRELVSMVTRLIA